MIRSKPKGDFQDVARRLQRKLVLDSEAVSILASGSSNPAPRIREALEAAHELGREVVTPAVVLAEVSRGRAKMQGVRALLNRGPVRCVDTDVDLAMMVAGVLHAANAGSEDIIDAHCVAVAGHNGGVILTVDVGDMERLAAPFPNVMVDRV